MLSNAKLEQKLKEGVAAVAMENAKKMSIIQEELRASNAKTDVILEMQSFARPSSHHIHFLKDIPLHNPLPWVIPRRTVILGNTPLPPVGALPMSAMLTGASNPHIAVFVAIQEDEDLRTFACESSSLTVHTPPPSRVGPPFNTDTTSFTIVLGL